MKSMLAFCILLLLAAGCSGSVPPSALVESPTPTPVPSAMPTIENGLEGLTPDQIAGLRSLEKVASYPLYTMHLSGNYPQGQLSSGDLITVDNHFPKPSNAWGCSLFAALGDSQNPLYGRNFDWEFSPALLLFTDPADGYTSVSMVDIAYFGFVQVEAMKLDELPLSDLRPLLYAVNIPFDGMNAQGLAVGMAAVPPGNMTPDPQKKTISSLAVIREMLDHAATVDEAVKILGNYNVNMEGGPPVHYLIADASRQAALVEFYQGEMVVTRNDSPWHLATNFLLASTNGHPNGQCRRYDAIQKKLSESNGVLDFPQSLDLLDQVHQDSTQWSIVYHMMSGEIQVALGHNYGEVYHFNLK